MVAVAVASRAAIEPLVEVADAQHGSVPYGQPMVV